MASPFVNPFRGHTMLSLLAALVGTVAYVGVGAWLMEAAAWTDTCRPEGRKFAYMLSALSCSPGLLDRGWAGIGLVRLALVGPRLHSRRGRSTRSATGIASRTRTEG